MADIYKKCGPSCFVAEDFFRNFVRNMAFPKHILFLLTLLCLPLHVFGGDSIVVKSVIRDPGGAKSFAKIGSVSTSAKAVNGNVGEAADVFVLQRMSKDTTFTMTRADIVLKILSLEVNHPSHADILYYRKALEQDATAKANALENGTPTNVTVKDGETYTYSSGECQTEITPGANEELNIDIYEDAAHPSWGPIFVTRGGQTASPYEGSPTLQVEVPEISFEGPASKVLTTVNPLSFALCLTNKSETKTDLTYKLSFNAHTRPDGLQFTLDGKDIPTSGVNVKIPADSTVKKILNVTAAEDEFNKFDDIKLYLSSRSDQAVLSSTTFSVKYVKLSPVKIKAESRNGTVVTLYGYDKTNPAFYDLKLQCKLESDSTWQTLKKWRGGDLPNDSLTWMIRDDQLTADGQYALRAIAMNAYEGEEYPVVSDIFNVTRDKTPPQVVGTPSPANGILTENDTLSIEFDEDIRQITKDNVCMNADFECVQDGRKITIFPTVTNDMEGRRLNVRLRGVTDMSGNVCDDISWQAVVNFNHLSWCDTLVTATVVSGHAINMQTGIANNGTSDEKWTISNVPAWLTPERQKGDIAAGDSLSLSFTVSPTLVAGQYSDTLSLTGSRGVSIPLPVILFVTAELPGWSVSGSGEATVLTALCNVKGRPCDNASDRLAAFDESGKCVGVATGTYDIASGRFLHVMDLYGTPAVFKYWEATSGKIYTPLLSDYTQNPVLLTAVESVEQKISLKEGWNWISFNTGETQGVMTRFAHVAKAVECVESGEQKADFEEGLAFGNLKTVSAAKFYKVKVSEDVALEIHGVPTDILTNIHLKSGWNEIAFLPRQTMSVEMAFANLAPSEGDVVKSLDEIATYSDGRWQGTLTELHPGAGYMYDNLGEEKTFRYPTPETVLGKNSQAGTSHFSTDWHAYPDNMTFIGRLDFDGEVAAYVGAECRGHAQTANGLVWLTVTGGLDAQRLTFRAWDSETKKEVKLVNEANFVTNGVCGSMDRPYEFAGESTGVKGVTGYGLRDKDRWDLEGRRIEELKGVGIVGKQKIIYKQ